MHKKLARCNNQVAKAENTCSLQELQIDLEKN